ncbi:hypothetical protein D3C79_997630 [compost metagenome]
MLAVTNDRMTKMHHMTTQLMLAAVFRLQLQQAVARTVITANGDRHLHLRQRPVVGDRRLRAFIGRGMLVGDFVQFFR